MLLSSLTSKGPEAADTSFVGGVITIRDCGQRRPNELSQNCSENYPRNIRMFGTYWQLRSKPCAVTRKTRDSVKASAIFHPEIMRVKVETNWQSEIQTASLEFGRGDSMLLNLLIKRAAGDAEPPGGLLYATAFLLKYTLNVLLFQFEQREVRVEKRRAHLCVTVEMKIVECDVFLITQQHRAFDNVAQLANVAGP